MNIQKRVLLLLGAGTSPGTGGAGLRPAGSTDRLAMPLLEYATPKLARFEDVRVGVLRAALAAAILAYVVI